MRVLFVIFALSCGMSIAAAQTPVIDSMRVDEWKGQLSIFGKFGTTQGSVQCDSVVLPILAWSDSLVVVTIPDTGKGSSGGVLVHTTTGMSNQRMITKLHVVKFSGTVNATPNVTQEDFYMSLVSRTDMHSKTLNTSETIEIIPSKESFLSYGYSYESEHDPNYNYYTVFYVAGGKRQLLGPDSMNHVGFRCTGYVNTREKSVNFYIDSVTPWPKSVNGSPVQGQRTAGHPFVSLSFDSLFNFSHDTTFNREYNGGTYPFEDDTMFYYGQAFFPPPSRIVALFNNPSLIGPTNGRNRMGYSDASVSWNTLFLMDSYHLQLALDSSFSIIKTGKSEPQAHSTILDTVLTSTLFTFSALQPSTTYYWRLAGVNSEGQSRWSDIWHFTTGTNADVKEINDALSYSITPNPATNHFSISYALPTASDVSVSIYDMLGRKLRTQTFTAQGAGMNTIDESTAGLPPGTYIVDIRVNKLNIRRLLKLQVVAQ
jgi:hypothetical protein